MSVMRASGAMPNMTARQMATASFAVPKSVMNTIVGFRAGVAAASFGAGALPQPNENRRSMNGTANNGLFCSHRNMGFLSFRATSICTYGHFERKASRSAGAVFDELVADSSKL